MSPTAASLFGLSQAQALVVLFVLLPIALAVIVVPIVVWAGSRGPKPVLTSEILARGEPASARIVSVRPVGGFLDPRPMVRFQLQVTAGPGEEPFDLEVYQSFPKSAVRDFRPGDVVDIRLTAGRAAGAIVWGGPGA